MEAKLKLIILLLFEVFLNFYILRNLMNFSDLDFKLLVFRVFKDICK